MHFLLHAFVFASVAFASNTDLLSVLSSQPSLTKFTSLINAYPDLLKAAEAGDMTIIAPNDDAFETFSKTPTSAGNYSSSDGLYALMQYHILNGNHASYSITSTPNFIPSLLTNSSYTNVTTGQVVEAVTNDTAITFQSAVHQVSNIVGPTFDIVFQGGYIHIVDAVMIPPINILATITEYPLPYFIEVISVVLKQQYLQTIEDIANQPNQTYFVANDPNLAQQTVENQTQPLTSDLLLKFWEYDIIPGEIVYSPALTNGSKWRTAAGVDVTITELNGDFYINDAKITIKDILISNGVVHVIDKYLNYTNPDARPQINNATSSSASNATTGSSGGLSTGAKAGIGVGVAVAVLALIAIVVVFLRRRRANSQADERQTIPVVESENKYVHEKDSADRRHEMITKSYDASELHGQGRRYELESGISGHGTSSSPTDVSGSTR